MRKLIFTIGLAFALFSANAQTASPELVSSAGYSFKDSDYQIDWSVGECATETLSAGDYVITQGFHQNTYVITAVKNLRPEIQMTVYPNPTSNLVIIESPSFKSIKNTKVIVTDLSGKILQSKDIQSDKQQINFSGYADGTYLITVLQNNQLIKSFQIIKN